MNLDEIVTKKDLEEFKKEIIDAISRLPSAVDDDIPMTFEETMDFLGKMPRSTLEMNISNGEIATCKVGKKVVVLRSDAKAFLMKRRRKTNDEIARLSRR